MRFQGKVALVTGGGSGMGAATSMAFAKEGADVAIFDFNIENAEKVGEKLRNLGRKAITFKVDVADSREVNACVQKVYDELKHIDILVNCAGGGGYSFFHEMSEELWDRIIAVHLKGTFNVTRAVINGMIAQKYGKILSISSIAGTVGTPKHANYSAAKAGIIGMSKALAKEVARYGINVNCLAPGATDTAFLDSLKNSPEVLEMIKKSTPLGRMAKPEEMAAHILFFCSDEASYTTGQVISPNGGYAM